MAVVDVLKNWFLKLDELRAWITLLLPDFSLGQSEKQAVLDWVADYVTQPPSDFSESWRNGILLCELADKFSPDLFHGHGILDPKNCLHNVSLALEIIKGSFGLEPDVTPEDIVICAPQAEGKLVNLLLKLKERVETDKTDDVVFSSEASSDDGEFPDPTKDDSFAQGAGLVIAFLGRKASFIVFSNGSLSDPDVVVEIKGPDETYCCERITRRSPKRKSALPRSRTPRPMISQRGRSRSQTELWAVEETSKRNPKTIPLEYEVNDDFISIAYIPLKAGMHTINVIWHGRYVTGCPFLAMVEDSLDVQEKKSALFKTPILRKGTSETVSGSQKHSVKFKEPEVNKVKLSNVRSRRVLRYIVKIGTKDVVVEAENSEMLAPALQKLDFPGENTTPGLRRNSWGFVGDVHSQRRRSLMRQVGIDDSEEDLYRAQKRSFSVGAALVGDMEEGGATVSYADPSANTSVNSLGHENVLNNISTSDFSTENSSLSSKLPKLETVSEHLSSFTTDMSTETDDTMNTSEDEVFYKEQHTSICATPNSTLQSIFPKHYTSEIFCEINSEEDKAEQIAELDSTPRKTEEQSGHTSPNPTNVEEKAERKQQEKNNSVENMLPEDRANKQCAVDEPRIENPPVIKSTVTVYPPMVSEYLSNFSYKENSVSSESVKHELSEAATGNCSQAKLATHKKFNVRSDMFDDKDKEIYTAHAYFPKGNKMLVSEVKMLFGEENNVDGYGQTTNDVDKYDDEKTELLPPCGDCDRDNELGKANRSSELKNNTCGAVNGSNAKEWNAANVLRRPQYCNAYNFEDVSIKPNIAEKTIATEKRYVSKAITSIGRANRGPSEGMTISDFHSEDTKKNQSVLDKGHWENFEEQDSERTVTMVPSGSEPGEYILQLSSYEGTTSETESDIRNELSLSTEVHECLPLNTKPTKSESTLKFNKARRVLSHPYLKSTYHKTESASLGLVPYLCGERHTKVPDLEKTDDGESPSRLKRRCEKSSCENMSENGTELQEYQDFFAWPTGLSNSNKESLLYSGDVRARLPEGNGCSFEKDDSKANDVSVPKPATGESMKFSLRSYKDKHRSGYEEIVPSNLVKDIVKDFHSRSLEYPAPRSDKTNDIYLRRSFFPPLASNEGRKTVKNRISKWEIPPSMQKTTGLPAESNKSSIRDKLSLYVNVQSKVAFWETAYQPPEGGDIPDKDKLSVSAAVYAEKDDFKLKDVSGRMKQEDHAGFDSMRDSDHPAQWEAQPHRDSSHPVTSERTEDSGISDDLLMCLKTSDHKRPPMLLRHRSLSDPCIRPSSTRVSDFLSNFEENLNVIPSSLYSSSEEKSEEGVSESEDEDGNDEYIDDEIPDYAAMFLGDYISFTGLLGPERSSLRKDAITQYLQKLEDKSRHIFDPSLSRPHECRALGVGVHYGLVSMNNHFQVLTKGAGRGNLSVSIQGSGRHDVTKIIVTYSRNDVYDVIYQVLEPGYYIISVRWSDWSIPGSPFICKVTY